MYQKLKGMRDIFAPTIYKWQKLESILKNLAQNFGCTEIRTPILEESNLFLRSVGESSDIVSKEMYSFKDKGNRDVTMRPEGTAGVVRAFVENGLFNEVLPQKFFYFVNNFRYENPQSGRFREHSQFGVEFFGVDTAYGELELISLVSEALKQLKITDTVLHINSIGHKDCRAKFNNALKQFAEQNKSKFCEDCKRRMETNPLRMLDCKSEGCQEILNSAPKLEDFLCDDCKLHFEKVKSLLLQNDIPFVVDSNLVRGLDYYNKTVFEFVKPNFDGKGGNLTVCGGGRYDGLVEEIGQKSVPCLGFGMGLDRVVALLQDCPLPQTDVYVMNVGSVGADVTFKIATKLRKENLVVQCNLVEKSFKAQFKFAEKINAKFVCIVGDEDVKNKIVTLKNLVSGDEQKMTEQELLNFFKKGE